MAQPKPKTTRKPAKKQVRKPVKQVKKLVKASARKPAKQVRKPSKPVLKAKGNNKSQTRSKATAKKSAKTGVKTAKSTRKTQKRSARAPLFKSISKLFTGTKTTSKTAKTKNAPKRKVRAKAGAKKSSNTNAYSPRLLFTSVVIAGVAGMFYGHQIWVKGYANILGSNINHASGAPGMASTPGPKQTSPLFSTYPAWAQNFANDPSGKLDSKYWNIFKGVPQSDNHEAQYYTDNPANLHIKDGALSLMATHQAGPNGYKYLSARVDTEHKVSFLYGRIDVTAKVPNGVGTWPAVWFLPSNNKYADLGSRNDSFRYLNGGEMDMIEEVGFNPNVEYGIVHTKSDLTNHPDGVGTFNQVEVLNNNVQYNKYSMLWTPNSITFEVNDVTFFTYDRPPGADYNTWAFDQPFYMIINLAMGGKWGGEDTAHFPGNGIDDSALPTSLDIKSIYYYPYIQAPH
jgi:beta-glucanase (GH16 family)